MAPGKNRTAKLEAKAKRQRDYFNATPSKKGIKGTQMTLGIAGSRAKKLEGKVAKRKAKGK